MSRGAPALTLFGATWQSIIEQRPEFAVLDYDVIWGKDKKHNWNRTDRDRLNLVSLMKFLDWNPSDNHFSEMAGRRFQGDRSERFWTETIDRIGAEGLQEFARWAVCQEMPATIGMKTAPELTEDEISYLASHPITQPAPAQWGTW